MNQFILTNFQYPDIKPEHYKFGSALLGEPLRTDGDWRKYLPPSEDQNVRGIESSACFVEAQQHAVATIEEESLGEKDNNYESRFNALLSGGSESGGDPLRGADSMRNDGLVTSGTMPFGDSIQSWEDFHSWKGVNETAVRLKGQEYRGKKKLTNDIVFQKDEPLATKYQKLRLALKYSPCPISVYGWVEENGQYVKPESMRDNHLVLAVYLDDQNRIYIWDTYAPYLKVLAPNYNSEFCMRWSVSKRTVPLEQENKLILLYKQLVVTLTSLLAIIKGT